ncbi:hypothetical protein, partial [Methanolobus sp.]|uniref:hypothetical protein n=1 Tax=Methanolobus sp. TaxID=1874737 RepID=UPI00272FF0B9
QVGSRAEGLSIRIAGEPDILYTLNLGLMSAGSFSLDSAEYTRLMKSTTNDKNKRIQKILLRVLLNFFIKLSPVALNAVK